MNWKSKSYKKQKEMNNIIWIVSKIFTISRININNKQKRLNRYEKMNKINAYKKLSDNINSYAKKYIPIGEGHFFE